ncbi:uncharacterized protein LOC116207055 [Punica granatum]|uniref:Uncharacterized protein n=2 Tax=Punica granatum TaxID=22663 RepID=A0A218XBQ0_PUNGR|nr:uncharacterized protein LOC116207055 [Punica granatum]OWM82354.1 hypothetical protein CDL15_Pgr001928 [Punica granatum]PKI62158.1 hypothetical protein CRG98_017531 [Punica granatum]
MSSVCISNCVKDARGDPRVPVRATYVNLYKWPESDAEFVRSVSFRMSRGDNGAGADAVRHGHPRVVDSISCRQMYLRSYPFSKEEDVPERTRCFGKLSGEKKKKKGKKGEGGERDRKWRCIELKRMKEASWKALYRIFNRLLSCSASVDVADHYKDF